MTYIIVCYYSGVAESGSERVWVFILNLDKPRLVSIKTNYVHSRTLYSSNNIKSSYAHTNIQLVLVQLTLNRIPNSDEGCEMNTQIIIIPAMMVKYSFFRVAGGSYCNSKESRT